MKMLKYFICYLAFWIGLSNLAFSQLSQLPFEVIDQSYSEITDGVVMASGEGVYNQVYTVQDVPPITLYNSLNIGTTLRVYSNGFISTYSGISGSSVTPFSTNYSGNSVFSIFGTQLKGKSTSSISYKIIGTAPNQVLTIQWKDFGIGSNALGSVNFQCKFFQTLNQVQYVYGNCNVPENTNVFVGIKSTSYGSHIRTQTTGSWYETSLTTSSTGTCLISPQYPLTGNRAFLFKNPTPSSCLPPPQITSLTLSYLSTNYQQFSANFSTPGFANGFLALITKNSFPTEWPVQGQQYLNGDSIGNSSVIIVGGINNGFTWGGSTGDLIRVTIFPFNNLFCTNGYIYQTNNPLSESILINAPIRNYYFQPTSGIRNLNDANNWSPSRNQPSINDTLHFINGGNVSLTYNNTTSAYTTFKILHFGANGVYEFDETDKSFSGTVLVDSGATLRLAMESSGNYYYIHNNSEINGTLELENAAVAEVSGNTEINGIVRQLGPYTSFDNFTSSGLSQINFNAGSVYQHQRNGGDIPFANYDSLSEIQISNVTTSAPFFPNNLSVGALSINCPDFQPANFNLNNNLNTIKSNLNVVSIGGTNKTLTLINTNSQTKVNGSIILNGVDLKFSGNANSLAVDGDIILNNCNYNAASVSRHTLNLKGNILFSSPQKSMMFSNSFSESTISFNNQINFIGNAPQSILLPENQTGACRITLNNNSEIILNSDLKINNNSAFILKQGSISGNGNLIYSGINNRLIYDSLPEFITSREWPDAANIGEVLIQLAPERRIYLTENKDVDTLNLIQGNIQLSDFDLQVNQKLVYSPSIPTSHHNLIIQNGTGLFSQNIKSTNSLQKYYFPIAHIDNQGVLKSNALKLNVFNNPIDRYLSAGFSDSQIPQAGDSSMHAHWRLHDNQTQYPLDFSLSGDYSPEHIPYPEKTYYPVQVIQNEPSRINGMLYEELQFDRQVPFWPSLDQLLLTASVRTDYQTYVWTGLIDSLFETPQNWLPNRFYPDASDVLLFNNSQQDSIFNIPQQRISQLKILNNTQLTVFPKVTADGTGTLFFIDAITETDSTQLLIDQNCSLTIANNGNEKWIWTTGFGINQIKGSLHVQSFTDSVSIDIRNSPTKFLSGSILKLSGNLMKGLVSNQSNCTFAGTYIASYSIGGASLYIPAMTKLNGSKLLYQNQQNVSSYSYYPFNVSTTDTTRFSVFEIDFPALTSHIAFAYYFYEKGLDSLIIRSTGTGEMFLPIQLDYSINTFIQYEGKLKYLNPSASLTKKKIRVHENFIQHGGGIIGNSSKATFILDGDGTSAQYLKLVDLGTNSIEFSIENPAGIFAIGASDFQPYLFLGDKVSLNIVTHATHPVQNIEEINLWCDSLTTSINYYVSTRIDSLIFSGNNPPPILQTFATDTLIHNLKIRELYIGANLHVGNHEINLNPDNYIYGVRNQYLYSSGLIFEPGGSIVIDIKTSTNPQGSQYPLNYDYLIPIVIGDRVSNLRFAFYPDSIISEGKIRITPVWSDSTTISIPASPDTLISRSFYGWYFQTEEGLSIADSSIWIEANYPFPLNDEVAGSIKLCNSHTTLGVDTLLYPISIWNALPDYYKAANFVSLSEIDQDTLFFGFIQEVDKPYITVQSGNWNNPSTWNVNSVPDSNATALIQPGHIVHIADNSFVHSLLIDGTLILESNSLIVDSIHITASGVFNQLDGYFRLGADGGDNKRWNNFGIIETSGGLTQINGGLSIQGPNGYWIQHGGTVEFDPFSHTTEPLATPGFFGNSIVEIQFIENCSLEAGIIHFVDPNPDSTSFLFDFYNYYNTPANSDLQFGDSHKTIFGSSDGIDGLNYKFLTTREGSSQSFVNAVFNDVEVVASSLFPSARRNYFKGSLAVKRNISLFNPGAYLECNYLNLSGDFYFDSLTTGHLSNFYFQKSDGTPNQIPQRVFGAGTFKYTYSLNNDSIGIYSIRINNLSASGVSFESGDLGIRNLDLVNGKLNMHDGLLSVYYLPVSNPNSWVLGKYRSLYNPYSNKYQFPLGDSLSKTEISIIKLNNSFPVALTGTLLSGNFPDSVQNYLNNNQRIKYGFNLLTAGINSPNQLFNIRFPINPEKRDVGVSSDSIYGLHFKNSTDIILIDSLSIANDTINYISNYLNLAGTYYFGEATRQINIMHQPVELVHCYNQPSQLSAIAISSENSTAEWQLLQNGIWNPISPQIQFNDLDTLVLPLQNQNFDWNGSLIRLKMWNNLVTVYSDSILYILTDSLAIPLSIDINNPTVCQGATVEISLNGYGDLPGTSLYWYENGLLNPDFTNQQTFLHDASYPGDYISYRLSRPSSCSTDSIVYYPPFTLPVIQSVAPLISIESANDEIFCSGQTIEIESTGIYAGNEPIYEWFVNNESVPGNSSALNLIPETGQVQIYCEMQSSEMCPDNQVVSSNVLSFTQGLTPGIPSVQLINSGPSAICAPGTFGVEAITANLSLQPIVNWAWSSNITNVGFSQDSLSVYGDILHGGDTVWTFVSVQNMDECGLSPIVQSDTVYFYGQEFPSPTVTIQVSPSDTIVVGQLLTFTANLTGDEWYQIAFEWTVNDEPVSNLSFFTSYQLQPGDVVRLNIVASGLCSDESAIWSNLITMKESNVPLGILNNQVTAIYPNPVQTGFFIPLNNSVLINSVSMYDLTGKCVLHTSVESTSGTNQKWISIPESLSDGIYFIELKGLTNSKIRIVKISP